MKASEMICLLAKQIDLNGDRDVLVVVNTGEGTYGNFHDINSYPLSVTKASDSTYIEIYGE